MDDGATMVQGETGWTLALVAYLMGTARPGGGKDHGRPQHPMRLYAVSSFG